MGNGPYIYRAQVYKQYGGGTQYFSSRKKAESAMEEMIAGFAVPSRKAGGTWVTDYYNEKGEIIAVVSKEFLQ